MGELFAVVLCVVLPLLLAAPVLVRDARATLSERDAKRKNKGRWRRRIRRHLRRKAAR